MLTFELLFLKMIYKNKGLHKDKTYQQLNDPGCERLQAFKPVSQIF